MKRRDAQRELAIRGKRVLRKRINSPAIVPCLPIEDYNARRDAAVVAWINDIFAFYEIDPSSPDRWEQAFWYLAAKAFPNFRLLNMPDKGRPKATMQKVELLEKFNRYRPRRKGSKYKNFIADHATDCAACHIRTPGALKVALVKARREREAQQRGTELLLREAAARALGINIHAPFELRSKAG